MRNSGFILEGFLPPHSLVMGKFPRAEALPEPSVEGFCPSCSSPGHLLPFSPAESHFCFVSGYLAEDGPEREMLARMQKAMNLAPGAADLRIFQRSGHDFPVGCLSWELSGLRKGPPGVLVVFGEDLGRAMLPDVGSHLRGQVHRKDGWQIVVTETLADLCRQPERKRIAWEELKQAVQAAADREGGRKAR